MIVQEGRTGRFTGTVKIAKVHKTGRFTVEDRGSVQFTPHSGGARTGYTRGHGFGFDPVHLHDWTDENVAKLIRDQAFARKRKDISYVCRTAELITPTNIGDEALASLLVALREFERLLLATRAAAAAEAALKDDAFPFTRYTRITPCNASLGGMVGCNA